MRLSTMPKNARRLFCPENHMAFETVFSSHEKVEFVKRPALPDFHPAVLCLYNDPTINAQRVALRVMEGGHACRSPNYQPLHRSSQTVSSLVMD